VSYFLAKLSPDEAQSLRARVARELKTIFMSRYTAEISLSQAVSPDVIRAYAKHATGEKYLIVPNSPERYQERPLDQTAAVIASAAKQSRRT
jgi:hypothetical protein